MERNTFIAILSVKNNPTHLLCQNENICVFWLFAFVTLPDCELVSLISVFSVLIVFSFVTSQAQFKQTFSSTLVKYLGGTSYTLLYTQQDQLETRDLNENHDSWELSEPGCWYFQKLPIQTWSTAFEIHSVNQAA